MSRRQISFLDAALGIGRSLVSSAYWDADKRHCNWIGRSTQEVSQVGGLITPTAAALGPDLYGGSSGVALFLAHLADLSGDEAIRAAAIAAIRNSSRNFERMSAAFVQPLSFHGGLIGLAFAKHQVATATGEKELEEETNTLLDRIVAAGPHAQVFDVVGGHAGAIPALLSLARSLSRPDLHELAVALGDDLLSAGHCGDDGIWKWDADRTAGAGISSVLLTGLARGGAGLGLALFELHAVTGRADFLAAGRGAFAYEDSLFDAANRNWPDLRSPDPAAPSAPSAPVFGMAWCHGAPGIALARARASHLDSAHAESHRTTARTAMATTLGGITPA